MLMVFQPSLMPILIYNFSIRGVLIITTYGERQLELTNFQKWGINQKENEIGKQRGGRLGLNEDITVVLVWYNTAES